LVYADKNIFLCDTVFMEPLFGLGDVIRKLRLKRKMGVIKFAKAAGVNKATISKIENGGNFEIDTFEKIARALGMSMTELHSYLDLYSLTPSPHVDAGAQLCSDEAHRTLQIKLDRILHSEQRCVDAVTAGVEALYAHCTGNDPDAAAIFPPEKELDPKTLRPKRPRKRTA
jgi:transcriptional regulator with XRE-family HTH domain